MMSERWPHDGPFKALPIMRIRQTAIGHKAFMWRYWHPSLDGPGRAPSRPEIVTDTVGVYIVAVIDEIDGELDQWYASIGASLDGAWTEDLGYQHVADYGVKLMEDEALAFFPMLDGVPYRM